MCINLFPSHNSTVSSVFLSMARNPEAIKEKSDTFNHAQMNFFRGGKKHCKQSKKGKRLRQIFVMHIIKDYFLVLLRAPLSQYKKKTSKKISNDKLATHRKGKKRVV